MEPVTTPTVSMPSATGLHVFAKREGLWDDASEALSETGEPAALAAKSLLLAYHQKHLGLSLSDASEAVDSLPELALEHYAKALTKFIKEAPVVAAQLVTAAAPVHRVWEALRAGKPARSGDLITDGTRVSLHGAPIFQIVDGDVQVNWSGKVSLTTASAVNTLATLAGLGRPFRVNPDGQTFCQGSPCSPREWITLGKTEQVRTPVVLAGKTAASYPESVSTKGGDPGKIKSALEKAVKALNEASVAGLKFDDRITKLEQDTYGLLREYLAYVQQTEALEARDKAQEQGVTGSLSTPPTDEHSGEFDNGDIDTGDSVTASDETDQEILTVARTKSLAQAREEYRSGRMSQDVFDAFVPLWEALHQHHGAEELQASFDRGEIDRHVFTLGLRLLGQTRN